jgi:putative hydrolase of the HAD superfamily
MGVQDRFDAVVTFDDSRMKKPGLRPFRLALRKLRVGPRDALVVGDSMSKDMIPARELGMTSVLAEYGRIKPAKGRTDLKIKRFKDLLKLI